MKQISDKELLSFLREVQRIQRSVVMKRNEISFEVTTRTTASTSGVIGEKESSINISVGRVGNWNSFTIYQFWSKERNETELEELEELANNLVKL